MKLRMTVFIALLALPMLALASDEHRTEITIYSGISFPNLSFQTEPCFICAGPVVPDYAVFPFTTQTELGHSFLFGVKTGVYINRNIEVEGNFGIAPHQEFRQVSGIFCPPGVICPLAPQTPIFLYQENVVSYFYDGDFVYNFMTGNVRPFAEFGIGGTSASVQNNTSTDFTLVYGGGAKFYFRNFGFRFEVNDHLTPNNFLTKQTEHYVQVQYGFLFRL